MSVRKELEKLGKDIARDAKQGALKNKKTGALDRSIGYETVIISEEKFQLIINEKYYGKYLNNKTHYMDKAIENNIDKGLDSIIDTMVGEIMNTIKTDKI